MGPDVKGNPLYISAVCNKNKVPKIIENKETPLIKTRSHGLSLKELATQPTAAVNPII